MPGIGKVSKRGICVRDLKINFRKCTCHIEGLTWVIQNARSHTVSKLDVHIGMFFAGKHNQKYIGVLINVMTFKGSASVDVTVGDLVDCEYCKTSLQRPSPKIAIACSRRTNTSCDSLTYFFNL